IIVHSTVSVQSVASDSPVASQGRYQFGFRTCDTARAGVAPPTERGTWVCQISQNLASDLCYMPLPAIRDSFHTGDTPAEDEGPRQEVCRMHKQQALAGGAAGSKGGWRSWTVATRRGCWCLRYSSC